MLARLLVSRSGLRLIGTRTSESRSRFKPARGDNTQGFAIALVIHDAAMINALT